MNIKEIKRYLGYKNNFPDDNTINQITAIYNELSVIISPRTIYAVYDCFVDGENVTINNITFKSKSLSSHIKDCKQAVVIAVTLGIESDIFIKKKSIQNIALGTIADAVATSLCEECCDKLETTIQRETSLNLKPRFSPGYGDLDISYQPAIINMLKCNKIGIMLSDNNMMIPSKSVTAIIGLTDNEQCNIKKCNKCNLNCAFRED